ncbi:MAG: ABC transporter permease [Proteobacteria bacterium]|nr:ABC transporter permease [Pseudomonadota bacterium]MBU1582859.1 ABC transporter permease [Pseudomonadota bacterium]MBU2454108.1 ABC transporter permease [Pseudomonadota bacterium]MBU2631088.1 ABC transporter permease [Pseudomonadota bacterium]
MEDIIISTLQRTMVAGTPLLLATTGEIICERSGILNLGVEGVMSMGAVVAFIVTMTTGQPWLGVLAAIAAGIAFSIIHAFTCVTLQANQVVSGLALTMLGLGLSGMLGKSYVGKPLSIKMEDLSIPWLSDIPYLGKILFSQSPFFFIAVLLAFAAWFFLEKTLLGIQIRSTGENPKSTETQGVNVSRLRYLSVMIGGGFSALAGAHLSISYSKSWIEGMTAGRGWIAIALTIFALWNPGRAIWAAFLFGFIFVVQYLLQPLGISPNFLAMLPYIATLLILLLISLKDSKKLNAPAMLGEPYKRGQR